MAKPIIMVVEDDTDYANMITNIVKSTGKYDVVTAYSAKQASETLEKNEKWLKSNKVNLILLDIKMPETDGLQFLEGLRKIYNEDKIGVILISAYEDEEKWEKATSGFVAGYITKPFKEETLLSTINKFFQGKIARRQLILETFERHTQRLEEFMN